jgi:hypothetical protein
VVEVGKVVHHPECGELRRSDGTSLSGLTHQGMEKGRVKILGSQGGGRPLTVTTISQKGLRAILEKAKDGGKSLYPRCNCRTLMRGYLAQVDSTQDGADGERLDRSLVGLGEKFCEEMKKVDPSEITSLSPGLRMVMGFSEGQNGDTTGAPPGGQGELLGADGAMPSPEGLLSSAESSADAVPSSEGQLSLAEPPATSRAKRVRGKKAAISRPGRNKRLLEASPIATIN